MFASLFLILVVALAFGSNTAWAGSLSAALGATKLDGLDKFAGCQNESVGYREGLIADRLELKLANTPNLSSEERSQWLADIAALRQVAQTHQANQSMSQHYFLGLTDEEQVAINSLNTRFIQEVQLKCEQKYGGMTRYSGPGTDLTLQRDYENSLRAQMREPLSLESIPVTPLPSSVQKSPAEIAEEKRAARQALRQKAAKAANDCMSQMKGLRPRLVAQALERKLDSGAGLSPKDRAEIQTDIQSAWASAGKGLDQIESVDPKNPYRAEMRLSPQDQLEINNEYMKQSLQLTQNCVASQRA